MQISQTSPDPSVGTLRLSGEDAFYDSTTARICALDPERSSISLAELATQGHEVLATENRGNTPLGAWLGELLREAQHQIIAARCTRPCSTLVEVRGEGGTLSVSHNEDFARARRERHEQRNLINAIQMNGELLKILATKENAERFEGIAEKILSECRRFEFDEVGLGPGRVAEDSVSNASAQRSLSALTKSFDSGSSPANLRVVLPPLLPQSLLDYLTNLILYGKTISPGAALEISSGSKSRLEAVLEGVTMDTVDAEGFLNPARLPATTAAFTLRQSDTALRLQFTTL